MPVSADLFAPFTTTAASLKKSFNPFDLVIA